MLAIILSSSDLAPHIGIQKLADLNLKSLVGDNMINIEMDGVRQESKIDNCPLKLWNADVRCKTQMSIADDIRPAYIEMCTIVN